MKELAEKDPELENEIVAIIEKGNEYSTKQKYDLAISLYDQAWGILPEPKLEWEMLSSWLAGSYFTANFHKGDFGKAKEWALKQKKADDSEINTAPSIDLGMVYYELSNFDEAYRYFNDAYGYGKERAFKGRPKKYLEFYLNTKKNHIH